MKGTWRTTTAGILEIVGGLLVAFIDLIWAALWGMASPSASELWPIYLVGLVVILIFVGGILAMTRGGFWWAVACAILLCFVLIGIPALVLLYESKGEFRRDPKVGFNGWYVNDIRVDTATKGDTVTVRMTLSGGSLGECKARIRRDIRWADPRTIKELAFSYDGAITAKELSFAPPFATKETSTKGYYVDLIQEGYVFWTLSNRYPPRLRVKS